MKKCIYGGSAITLPDRITTPSELGRFSNDVIKALAGLRDRPVHAPSGIKGPSKAHPWKVTANGDDTVRIAAGKAHHWTIGEPGEGAALGVPVTYAGTDSHQVTTSDTSYLYAKIPKTSAQVAGATSTRQLSGTVTISDESDAPSSIDSSSNVWLLLAELSLSGGVVTVTEQKLDHNPVVSIQDNSASDPSHPWKVTENGDDTLTIADGSILYFTAGATGSVPNEPFDGGHIDYTSGDVTIGASGTLFAKISLTTPDPVATDNTFLIATYGVAPSTVPVEVDPSLSGSEMSIPIADVSLTAGVATVDVQYLVHNPLVDLTYAEGLTP